MRNLRPFTFIFLIVVSLFVSQCELEQYGCTDPSALNYDVKADIDDNSCNYSPDYQSADCISDVAGNLVINNQTGQTLLLYKDYTGYNGEYAFITCIPASSEDFIVDIPNDDLAVCLLQIWKAGDIGENEYPDLAYVYRQWRVALSNTSLAEERANWLITEDDNYAGSGTLLLSYPNIDEFGMEVLYQVDIFLNNKNGAKLASLQPGVVNKKVSVDYGVHYLYYNYWYSDPNSQSGEITDIGWDETNEVVINEYHKEAEIDIPVFYSTIGKVSEVTVINESNFAVNVYANDNLIEDIVIVDGSTHDLSTIPAREQSTFIIPVENYNFRISNLGGDIISEFIGVSIVQNEEVTLRSGIAHRTIRINNKTDETLGLYNEQEEYLGLLVDPGKISTEFQVPDVYDSLIVINFAKTKTKKFRYNAAVTIYDLEDYLYNRIEFGSLWPMLEGVYQSPEIADEESTSMNATLINSETAILSFEYNVSSEPTYDVFSFLVDGIKEISNASGETGWVSYSMTLDAGTHTLLWVYEKDRSRPAGRDNVQLRQINVE